MAKKPLNYIQLSKKYGVIKRLPPKKNDIIYVKTPTSYKRANKTINSFVYKKKILIKRYYSKKLKKNITTKDKQFKRYIDIKVANAKGYYIARKFLTSKSERTWTFIDAERLRMKAKGIKGKDRVARKRLAQKYMNYVKHNTETIEDNFITFSGNSPR